MNQDIDLLEAVSAESRRFPTGPHAAGILLATVIGALTFTQWLSGRVALKEQEIVDINSAIDDLVFNLEERSEFLIDRNADPLVLEQIKEHERELADKIQVLDLLSGETLGNTLGFASQLEALGRRHPYGLWLQRILIGDGGRQLELHGQAQDAGLIPRFLDALESETVFNGMAFETMSFVAGESGTVVDFVLATGCTASEEDPAEAISTCTGDEQMVRSE